MCIVGSRTRNSLEKNKLPYNTFEVRHKVVNEKYCTYKCQSCYRLHRAHIINKVTQKYVDDLISSFNAAERYGTHT